MKNIKRYTDHLRESEDQPKSINEVLIDELRKQEPSIDEVSRLLDEGADPNFLSGRWNTTCISLAAEKKNPEILRLLLERGGSTKARNLNSQTPLHKAALHGRLENIRELIERGSDINPKAVDGMTPLSYAVFGASDIFQGPSEETLEAVRLLIDSGADVNVETKYGMTPMGIAVSKRRKDIARVLIEAGADVSRSFSEIWKFINFFGGDIGWVDIESIPKNWLEGPRLMRNTNPAMAMLLIKRGDDPRQVFPKLEDLKDFFGGDISWLPPSTRRLYRSQGAFGRF